MENIHCLQAFGFFHHIYFQDTPLDNSYMIDGIHQILAPEMERLETFQQHFSILALDHWQTFVLIYNILLLLIMRTA